MSMTIEKTSGLGNNYKSNNMPEAEMKNPFYNKDALYSFNLGLSCNEPTSKSAASTKPIPLALNSIINWWESSDELVKYSIKGNTFTAQAVSLPADKHFAAAFVFTDSIETDGYTKLIVTVLEKSGKFDGDDAIGFTISNTPIQGVGNKDLQAPKNWNNPNGFIRRNNNTNRTIQVGDKLEFSIADMKEIYLGGMLYCGSKGRMTFSFELAK